MSNVEVEYLSRCDLKSDNPTDRSSRTESPLADYLSRVFPTLDLPKMSELDPESLLNLIASQKTTQTSNGPTPESIDNSAWRPILGCGQATRTEGSGGGAGSNFVEASSSTSQSTAYAPSAIEQMNIALESQLRLQTFENKSRDLFQRLLQASVAQSKRQMTITERVQVPSSDHVAEIVGKNGLRIKQIREHLKVWVKTPTRDELPIFEVTGLPDKVAEAVRILQQMSEHFSRVQQERQTRTEPTRVEEHLWVEQDKVGLLVGASGQTIRWVQQLSDTHIATPRKQERQPGLRTCFTICGTRERVQFAKQLMSEYVAIRCPGLWLEPGLPRSVEAFNLVADFQQIRQVVKATDAPEVTVTPAAPAAPAPAVVTAPAAVTAPTAEARRLQDARRLWPEVERPRRLWHSALFFGGLAEQRRYSADTPISPIAPSAAAAAAWPTPESPAALKKAQSDEQIGAGYESSGGFSGWM